MAAHAKTTDDRAMLLLGLQSSGAEESKVRAAATALRVLRRGDGGWASNPSLEGDACGTSSVSKSEIARRLQIGRTSVRRILGPKR